MQLHSGKKTYHLSNEDAQILSIRETLPEIELDSLQSKLKTSEHDRSAELRKLGSNNSGQQLPWREKMRELA